MLDGVRRRLLHRDRDVVDLVLARRPSARSQRRSSGRIAASVSAFAGQRVRSVSGSGSTRAASTATSSSAGGRGRRRARPHRTRRRGRARSPTSARSRSSPRSMLSPRTSTAPSVNSSSVPPAGRSNSCSRYWRQRRDARAARRRRVPARSSRRRAGAASGGRWPALTTVIRLGLEIEHGEDERRHLVRAERQREPVQPLHDARGRMAVERVGAQAGAHLRHHRRGADAVAHHVAGHERDAAAAERERVVPVAADPAAPHRGAVARGQLEPGDDRQPLRHEALLERLDDAALVERPRALDRGGRAVGGELEQLRVFVREDPRRERAHVQHADHLGRRPAAGRRAATGSRARAGSD